MRSSTVWLRRTGLAGVVVATTLVTALSGVAVAHPEHGDAQQGSQELFPGEGVAGAKQHDGDEGHLPARQTGDVRLVGKGAVSNPDGLTGRIADVTAHGNYAYLNAFREPVCTRGGVHVMDIADPTTPTEVVEAFMNGRAPAH